MMKVVPNHQGFTLIELLVSTVIFGLVVTAMYGVYTNMNNTSVNQQGVVDIQQELRVALDFIGHDIKMAGAIIPADQNPVLAATASSVTLQTASSPYTYAMISEDLEVAAGTAAAANIDFDIAMPSMVDYFSNGDIVRLLRPQSGEQPYPADLTVAAFDRTIPRITINGFANANAVQYKAGDLLARVNPGAPNPSNIAWDLNGNNLRRNRDGGGVEIISNNVTALGFTYILEDDTETATPAATELDNIKAVRVLLTGTAGNQLDGRIRQRSLGSIYYLRNRLL